MTLQFCRLNNHKLVRHFSLNISGFQKKSHYDCLGITPKATQGDIKSAYYKLSKQYHPDLNKGNEDASQKFRDITDAYEILGNLKSRKLYDRGLLVGGNVDNYRKSEEPMVVDNYSHAPFYHHRNKPASRKAAYDKTPHYDIDEWTRAHYSAAFSKAYIKKSVEESYEREKTKRTTEAVLTWQVIALLFFFTICGLMQGISTTNNYDSTNQLKPEEKPD